MTEVQPQHWLGGPSPVPDEHRQMQLQYYIAQCTRTGGRVESQPTPYNVVMVWGKPPNHILHLLLTLLTFFLWAPIWVIVAATQKERRMVATVDPWGNVNQI